MEGSMGGVRARWLGLASALVLLSVIGCGPSGAPAARPPGAGAAPAAPAAASGAPAAPAASGAPASSAAPAAPAAADPTQALVEAARREGQLTLGWAESVLGGSQMIGRLTDGFNRLYGLNVSVQYTPSPNMVEMGSKLAQEYQANRAPTTDVYVGPGRAIVSLMQLGALETVDWTAWAANVRDPRLVAPGGMAVEVAWFQPGITYDSSRLTGSMVPTSLEDLLQPQYAGRIASTPYAAFFDSLASPEVWGERRTLDYVTKLAAQLAGLMGCGESTRIVSGEFDLLALDCGAFDARLAQQKGAPVAQAIPSDAALIFPWYLTVPKNAAHPAAAKLFVNYLLGRDGQDIMYETHFTDHPLVAGSKIAPEIEKLRGSGAPLYALDVAFRQRNDEKELDRLNTEIIRIIQRR
jgi:iron(III) transport system substrate-binding protein